MAEKSFDWCWCAWSTKTLSKSAFKHANCLLSLTRCQGIPASVLSSISWMNARYEANAVGLRREMFLNEFCIIIHQDLENIDFFIKTNTKTKTFISRPRPFFMSSRHLESRDQDQGLEITSLNITLPSVRIKHTYLLYGFPPSYKDVLPAGVSPCFTSIAHSWVTTCKYDILFCHYPRTNQNDPRQTKFSSFYRTFSLSISITSYNEQLHINGTTY